MNERRTDPSDAHKLYVRTNVLTGATYEERTMGPREAMERNGELDEAGSPSRWFPYASREGEGVQAA